MEAKKQPFTPIPAQITLKDNPPSNGWFPQRLKAYVTGQRLKALAFTMFKPIAFVTFATPEGAVVLLTTLERVFVLFPA